MTKRNQTASRDSFDALHVRLMSVTTRLQVVSEVLNTEAVPIEFSSAAYVLRETAKDMDKLWGDLETWNTGHEHTPKAPKEVQS